jgi:hypothetical protein
METPTWEVKKTATNRAQDDTALDNQPATTADIFRLRRGLATNDLLPACLPACLSVRHLERARGLHEKDHHFVTIMITNCTPHVHSPSALRLHNTSMPKDLVFDRDEDQRRRSSRENGFWIWNAGGDDKEVSKCHLTIVSDTNAR